jgi:DNA-binding transcriptional LysR family regulator
VPPPHIPATHLFDDQLCLCVASNSPLAREPIDWRSLSDHTLIGPLGADPMWGQFSLLGIRPRSRIRVSNVELAMRLVEDGHAVALLYRSVAMAESVAGRITMLELPDAPLTVSYWMAIRRSATVSPLVERFAKLLVEHARQVLAADHGAP